MHLNKISKTPVVPTLRSQYTLNTTWLDPNTAWGTMGSSHTSILRHRTKYRSSRTKHFFDTARKTEVHVPNTSSTPHEEQKFTYQTLLRHRTKNRSSRTKHSFDTAARRITAQRIFFKNQSSPFPSCIFFILCQSSSLICNPKTDFNLIQV